MHVFEMYHGLCEAGQKLFYALQTIHKLHVQESLRNDTRSPQMFVPDRWVNLIKRVDGAQLREM
jgi:hypothetical protein